MHHAGMDTQPAHEGGFDPADYVWPSWSPRCSTTTGRWRWTSSDHAIAPDGGAGAHHADDVVLRARRLR